MAEKPDSGQQPKMQWHPLFAHFLRPMLGAFYEVETERPVSDLPRRADVVVLRRTGGAPPPFTGLWSHLRPWNVLELKGPTDSPEEVDLELLMHVGTGITLAYNEERGKSRLEPMPSSQVALWYFALSLGPTFLEALQKRAFLTYQGGGLWLGQTWGHPVLFVSYGDLPVEVDSIPLHLLRRPGDTPPPGLASLLVQQAALLPAYNSWIATAHNPLWKEMKQMASLIPPEWINWKEVFPTIDLKQLIQALNPQDVLDVWGPERFFQLLGPEEQERAVAGMTPERRLELLLHGLTPEERQQLLRQLLQDEPPRG
jgi:hypothetical protein